MEVKHDDMGWGRGGMNECGKRQLCGFRPVWKPHRLRLIWPGFGKVRGVWEPGVKSPGMRGESNVLGSRDSCPEHSWDGTGRGFRKAFGYESEPSRFGVRCCVRPGLVWKRSRPSPTCIRAGILQMSSLPEFTNNKSLGRSPSVLYRVRNPPDSDQMFVFVWCPLSPSPVLSTARAKQP